MEHLINIFNDFFCRVQFQSPRNWNEEHVIAKLSRYATMIHEENQKYNLTGFKSLDEIAENLVFESIVPLMNIDVPRGTSFVDIGCGAGVPGIPLGIMYPEMRGVLIDSNKKKAVFVSNVIKELQIDNLSVSNDRAEEIANLPEFRQKANLVLCRAFAEPYVSLEAGLPMLCVGGVMYIFSKFTADELEDGIIKHALKLGSEPVQKANMHKYGFPEVGLLFVKVENTPSEYPRRFSVIKKCAEPFRRQV